MTHNDLTTTFSLCTFGQLLLQRHRLAMTLHQSLVPDAPLWAYQAFLLAPAGPDAPRVASISADPAGAWRRREP